MDKSFIEVQFPVSKISKESYKERKAVGGQTLTGLGKWWGRKPLILVRATILGLLLNSTNNTTRDREIFLKILSMDKDGLWERKNKNIPIDELYELATDIEKIKYFNKEEGKISWKSEVKNVQKQSIQKEMFFRLNYDRKLSLCIRPEELLNYNATTWTEINTYLGTTANNIQDLIQQLSIKRYGKVITVGDCFSGGGSIPFEAARIGLNAYGSDLNPIATLLTWSALNINGADEKEINKLRDFQKLIFDIVDKQIIDWEIETNVENWRANSYLYCNETLCPSCRWRIPLLPSLVIGKANRTIATLTPIKESKSYAIDIKMHVGTNEFKEADRYRTIESGSLKCPNCKTFTPIQSLRRDRKDEEGNTVYGLRMWGKEECVPRLDDIFQERLYCIRYEEIISKNGKTSIIRHYVAPTERDFNNEKKVEVLLLERFKKWQELGYIPSEQIEEGEKTIEPIRNRGWAFWHHLFNPRQLLINGLLMEQVDKLAKDQKEKVIGILGVNRASNWNSKLSRWNPAGAGGIGKVEDTFYNQAFNTLFTFGVRSCEFISNSWFFELKPKDIKSKIEVYLKDARNITNQTTYWITDPPYADAVNYHELSEFFLVWDKKILKKTFPEWYTESKRNAAVKGNDQDFTKAMIEVYRKLTERMDDNGNQVVMFTHQDPAVWAELSLILWSAGLQVTAAWNIATETDSVGIKSGNYVKGTVLLVLRKNMSNLTGWLDDIYPQIKDEVKSQIDSMMSLDNNDDPDFTDNDYLLAAYAASLKILTKYKKIGDIDVEYEIEKKREKGSKNPIQLIIESAIKVAYDYLIPKGISKNIWKELSKEEKFYIKGLDFERNGIFVLSAYQELARGLGVNDYTDLLASTKANRARLKTPEEFSNKQLSTSDMFSQTIIRQVLMAVYLSLKQEDAISGKNWFRNEVPDYWNNRTKIIEILKLIQGLQTVSNTEHWQLSAQYAGYLQSLVENDGL